MTEAEESKESFQTGCPLLPGPASSHQPPVAHLPAQDASSGLLLTRPLLWWPAPAGVAFPTHRQTWLLEKTIPDGLQEHRTCSTQASPSPRRLSPYPQGKASQTQMNRSWLLDTRGRTKPNPICLGERTGGLLASGYGGYKQQHFCSEDPEVPPTWNYLSPHKTPQSLHLLLPSQEGR